MGQELITEGIVIAAGLTHHSKRSGIEHGVHKVAEVIFGCLVVLLVSLLMAKIWRWPRLEMHHDHAATRPTKGATEKEVIVIRIIVIATALVFVVATKKLPAHAVGSATVADAPLVKSNTTLQQLAQQRDDTSSGSIQTASAKTKRKKIEAPPQSTRLYNPDAVSVGVKKAKK